MTRLKVQRWVQLAQSLETYKLNNNEFKASLDEKNNFLQRLQSMAFEFVKLSKRARYNLIDEERIALEKLASDKTIVITKADKGNSVVIQDVEYYRNKISELLLKSGKFKRLNRDLTITRERK